MTLSDLRKADRAIIIRVNANKSLRDRLSSFGIMRGEELVVKGCSLGGKTIEIEVGSTLIALRADEASNIEVEKICIS